METENAITSHDYGSLWLIRAIFNKFGIGKIIDRELPSLSVDKILSNSQACLGLLLLTYGSKSNALYRSIEFFRTIDTEKFIGPKILPSHMNASAFGRFLDSVCEYGIEKLYNKIILEVLKYLDLEIEGICVDSTTFSLEGVYLNQHEIAVTITYGKSKDNKDNCKQITFNMATDMEFGIPLFIRPGNGNQSDKVEFGNIVLDGLNTLLAEIGQKVVIIMDSAFYTYENLLKVMGKFFLTRVPNVTHESKAWMTDNTLEFTVIDNNYSYYKTTSNYGGVQQNISVIFSKQAHERNEKSFVKKFAKIHIENKKKINKRTQKSFGCEFDAQTAHDLLKKDTLRSIKSSKVEKIEEKYWIIVETVEVIEATEAEKTGFGRFILATNKIEGLEGPEMLELYQNQQSVERGFRYVKDKRLYADGFFLKSNKRIQAMLFIRTLGLLINGILQKDVREKLIENDCFVNDQKGKPIQNPTARWIIQEFDTIKIVNIPGKSPLYANIEEKHLKLLKLLGPEFEVGYKSIDKKAG